MNKLKIIAATALAEKSDSAGFAFFAIDLHYNGRSYRAGEPRSDMRSVKEYYAELDALNSPFLDYKNSWFVRNIAYPVFSDIALLMPDMPAPKQESPKYNMSLLKTEKGEWEFNTELKSDEWPQQYFGYLRATERGIKWIHAGMQINAPVLMMRSGCTIDKVKWDDDYMRCDCMLDVNLLEKWAPKLGPDVTTVTVEDGMHDLFLSRKSVRDYAYRSLFEFLDNAVARKNVVVAYYYIVPQ